MNSGVGRGGGAVAPPPPPPHNFGALSRMVTSEMNILNHKKHALGAPPPIPKHLPTPLMKAHVAQLE